MRPAMLEKSYGTYSLALKVRKSLLAAERAARRHRMSEFELEIERKSRIHLRKGEP